MVLGGTVGGTNHFEACFLVEEPGRLFAQLCLN
jgi:hypothetical protein